MRWLDWAAPETLFTMCVAILGSATLLAIVGILLIYLAGEHRQRLRLEEEVARRTEELRRALMSANEASRAKTDFIARVSHDLRSPLTSILGYSQLLSEAGGPQAYQARTILRSARHMLDLINDLIEYTRGGGDKLNEVPVRIQTLLETIVQEAWVLARQNNNQFVSSIQRDLPTTLVLDGTRLRQILLNLLDNAAKFTRNGMIELVAGVEASGHEDQSWLWFSIRDTGCGIAPDDQGKVFEPFFRSADLAEGVGLGLAIVAEWTRRMNGTLTLHSAPGEGTEIKVRLLVRLAPLMDAEADLPPQPAASDEPGYRQLAAALIRADSMEGEAGDDVAPPAEVLEQLERLLAIGALTDLRDRVETLYLTHPQCRRFVLLSRALLEKGDLDALRWLIECMPACRVQTDPAINILTL
ncbi:sensor histidine kinase [Halopseudomonas xiamenensis]|uniref:sensor histidine kinase n=1 Tax=Halopseudomonas xiamenensis TaxID=157792 RepID=UPI00162A154F|nr:HAMP domain-containing sensor histidine kinase [Halopseudomonas xiamenensis]